MGVGVAKVLTIKAENCCVPRIHMGEELTPESPVTSIHVTGHACTRMLISK